MSAPEAAWTVIGLWVDDQPLVAGVVPGDLPVEGGCDGVEGDLQSWATTVTAPTAAAAELRALDEMEGA